MTHFFTRAKFIALPVFFIISTCTRAESTQTVASNDVIYHNAVIYTVNPLRPWAESIAVRNGKIVAVGSNEEIDKQIGTAAIREFLDAVENTRQHSGKRVTNHIAHCSTIHPDDALRLRLLGVVCEMSPYIWFPSAGMTAASGILGEALIRRAYAAGTVVAAGGPLAAGSDWAYDNLDLNPLPYLESLVSRKDPFDRTPGQFNPDQALSVAQAIKTFTLNGALAMGTEKQTGSIEKGKRADFIVLDKNLFNIPVDSISEVNVELTVFNGQVVFQKNNRGQSSN